MNCYVLPIAKAATEEQANAQSEVFKAACWRYFNVCTDQKFIVAQINAENRVDAYRQMSEALADGVLSLNAPPYKPRKEVTHNNYPVAKKNLSAIKYVNIIMSSASLGLSCEFERLKRNFDPSYHGGDKLDAYLDTCEAVLNASYYQWRSLVKQIFLDEGVITQGIFDLYERRLSDLLQYQLDKLVDIRNKYNTT